MNKSNLFANLMAKLAKKQPRTTTCDNCSTSLQYVIDTGRLGCPKCYDVFLPTLKNMVSQMKQSHVGKRPKDR